MSLANRLKLLREEKHLTQQELADILGISKSTYIKYERGEREPRIAQLHKIAQALDVSGGYLIGTTDDPESLGGINLGNAALRTVLEDESFFDTFGVNDKAVKNVVYSYLSHIMLAYYGNIDLLYMELILIDKFENIHDSWGKAFCLGKMPNEEYKRLLEIVLDFRKKADEFLCLLQNPDFYHGGNFCDEMKEYQPPCMDLLNE